MANDLIKILLQAELNPTTSINKIQSQLNEISNKIKPIKINLSVDEQKLKDLKSISEQLQKQTAKTSEVKISTTQATQAIKNLEGITTKVGNISTKTWEDANGKVYKYTQTLQDLKKNLTVIDTYTKNKEGNFDFVGRTVNDQSVKNTRVEIEKLHIEALKMNKTFDETIIKNKQMTQNSYWKQQFQDMTRTSTEIQKLNSYYKELEITSQKIADFQKRMLSSGSLKGEMDIFAGKYKGKFDATEFNRLRTEIEGLQNLPLDQQVSSIRNLNIQWGNLRQTAMQSGSIISRSIENMGKFLRFYVAGGTLVRFVREIRAGIQSVKDLDKSLTELSKISNISSSQMEIFTDRAFKAGKTLARTGREVVDATAEFMRAGSDMEEAFILGQKALLLTNVGSGIDNVVDASSSLIAIMKGFKLEAQDTTHVVDALNEVANNYALDTVNLTEILKRTSGTLAQTGMGFEELLGLSVGGFESLRSAEQVASGLNMISQRLRGMAEDGSKVEGLVPKIQAAFDKYANGAVSVIDKQNGGLNSTFEILQQLSKVYPTLKDEQKAFINEAVAGNRKQNGGFVQKCA